MFFRFQKFQFELLLLYLFPQIVILNKYMLCLWMHHQILGNIYGTCVVTIYNHRFSDHLNHSFQQLFYPCNIWTVGSSKNILYFNNRLRNAYLFLAYPSHKPFSQKECSTDSALLVINVSSPIYINVHSEFKIAFLRVP